MRWEKDPKRSNIIDRRGENDQPVADRSDTLFEHLPATPREMRDYKLKLLDMTNYIRRTADKPEMPTPPDLIPVGERGPVQRAYGDTMPNDYNDLGRALVGSGPPGPIRTGPPGPVASGPSQYDVEIGPSRVAHPIDTTTGPPPDDYYTSTDHVYQPKPSALDYPGGQLPPGVRYAGRDGEGPQRYHTDSPEGNRQAMADIDAEAAELEERLRRLEEMRSAYDAGAVRMHNEGRREGQRVAKTVGPTVQAATDAASANASLDKALADLRNSLGRR